jgi:hypothetical protein
VDTHLLDLLSATKQRVKNTAPKTVRIKRENHGNGCPRAEARRQRHACVSGDKERIILNASGTWLKEKKVPLRKAIGRTTKLINKVIS